MFEGLLTSQFSDDPTRIEASPGTNFQQYLITTGQCAVSDDACYGTVAEWMAVNFSDFSRDHLWYDALYLVRADGSDAVWTWSCRTLLSRNLQPMLAFVRICRRFALLYFQELLPTLL